MGIEIRNVLGYILICLNPDFKKSVFLDIFRCVRSMEELIWRVCEYDISNLKIELDNMKI